MAVFFSPNEETVSHDSEGKRRSISGRLNIRGKRRSRGEKPGVGGIRRTRGDHRYVGNSRRYRLTGN